MHIHLQENLSSHEWPDRPRPAEGVKSLYMINIDLRRDPPAYRAERRNQECATQGQSH
jgi:hypothetical protein